MESTQAFLKVEKKGHSLDVNRGTFTHVCVIVGLAISIAFGIVCIVLGHYIRSHSLPVRVGIYSGGNLFLTLSPRFLREALLLCLNLTLVKLSVWSSGTVHETALRWQLAVEKDEQTDKMCLEFNANLRFLQSSNKWFSANGLTANVIMALCLAVSYAASSMVLMDFDDSEGTYNTVVPFVALYALGITTLLQSTIAIWAILTTHIPTWSQSALTTVGVLLREKEKYNTERVPGRCMHSLYDRFTSAPLEPRKNQEPAWKSHPQFRTFVMYIWMLVGGGYYWAFIIWGMMASGTEGSHRGSSWDPIPWSSSNNSEPLSSQGESSDTGSMSFGWEGAAPTVGLLWGLGILVGFQGGIITTDMTCAQTLVALVVDEHLWREASNKGTDPDPSFLKRIFLNWQTLAMIVAEPLFHWLFGLAVSLDAHGFQIHPVQILYVSIMGTVGVIIITVAGKSSPKTSQPSTYRHLQTLVDLIDEWHPKMYWGHKHGSEHDICHAGTSDDPDQVSDVLIGASYGGCKDKWCNGDFPPDLASNHQA